MREFDESTWEHDQALETKLFLQYEDDINTIANMLDARWVIVSRRQVHRALLRMADGKHGIAIQMADTIVRDGELSALIDEINGVPTVAERIL